MLYYLFEIEAHIILGVPNVDLAADIWKDKIRPVLDKTRYAALAPTKGRGSRGGRFHEITFRNGASARFMGAGGGDEQRSSHTAPVVILTEVDKMDTAGDVSRETDPVSQMESRADAFGDDALILGECTVSTSEGRIWREVTEIGSNGRIFIRCPHCHEYIFPVRENLTGWKGAANAVEADRKTGYTCQECGVIWDEQDRKAANRFPLLVHDGQTVKDGKAVGPDPTDSTFTGGIIWNFMHTPFVRMGKVGVEEWTYARDQKPDQEKKLCQFRWSVPYKLDNDTKELTIKYVLSHTGVHRKGVVPEVASFLLGGVDIQKTWLYWGVMGFDFSLRKWLIDFGVVRFVPEGTHDEPTTSDISAGLDQTAEIFERYGCKDWWYDVGYKHETTKRNVARDWCSRHPRARALVGRAPGVLEKQKGKGLPMPTGCEFVDARDQGDGTRLYFFDVEVIKEAFHRSFFVEATKPGSIEMPRDIGDHEWVARHICGERSVVTWEPGKGEVRKWITVSRRHDMLDIGGYLVGGAMIYVGANKPKHGPPARPKRKPIPGKGPGVHSIRANY